MPRKKPSRKGCSNHFGSGVQAGGAQLAAGEGVAAVEEEAGEAEGERAVIRQGEEADAISQGI